MRTVTFILNVQTGDDGMAPVTLTIIEQGDGSLLFTLSNENDGDNAIGDLRGLFFDVADDSLLGSLGFAGVDITEIDQSGSVSNLGQGATISGVPDGPYEVGVEFGTPGMNTDDLQTTSFVLTSTIRALTLDDIALEHIAVRQTSVSSADGGREDSDKLYGDVPYAVNAIDDAADATENQSVSGNLFANDIDLDAGDAGGDGIPDGLVVTAVNGDDGLVGSTIQLADGIFVTVTEDGSYLLDASTADWLAEGEIFESSVVYSVSDGNGGSDSATLQLSVTGVNDEPVALDDAAGTLENTVVQGFVLGNDTDPDLSDTLVVYSVNGDTGAVGNTIELASGAFLTLNGDGGFSYDPNGAFDGLFEGESATDSFTYQVSDGHGGFDDAVVQITIEGVGQRVEEDQDHFGEFFNKKGVAQDISNVVLYLRDDDGGFLKVKIDGWSGVTDLDDVDLDTFLDDAGYDDYELYAVSIKAGNNHNADLGPGEGQLFLLDGDEGIDYVAGGATPDDMSLALLGAKANVTFAYSPDLFI